MFAFRFFVGLFRCVLLTGIIAQPGCASDDPLRPEDAIDPALKAKWKAERELTRNIVNRLLAARGPFGSLKGEVVDEQGNRLDQVDINIDTTQINEPRPLMEETRSRNLTVNGTFDIDVKGGHGVELYFLKRGYYGEHFGMVKNEIWDEPGFSRRMLTEEVRPMVARGAIGLNPDGTIRVRLEKRGKVAALRKYNLTLECAADRSGAVFELGAAPSQALRKVKDLSDASGLPANGLMVIVPGASAEGLPTVSIQHGAVQQQYPRELKTVPCGDGGLKVFVPTDWAMSMREMKEAPAEGYQKEILLSAKDCERVDRQPRGSSALYFYFRLGSHYGKGRIYSVWSSGAKKAGVNVDLWIQPDGSRNLESGSDSW